MDTTIEQQVAMDEALVPHAQRIRIAAVYHYAIRFKMDNKKHIVNLESFRDMLHICPRVHGQTFAELPFEEEILAFIRFLGYSAAIRTLTDVNINKLYQPWRSFATIINKCLTGKGSGYDSLRLSQAQILWGLYHKRSVDYPYLMWEDFIYQVEQKNQKKSNEMYYPRFTKVIIHHFMSNDLSIPRRNKTHISQASGSGADEGTGSIPGVPDVPTDESEKELSWNSTDDKGDDDEGKDGDDDDDDHVVEKYDEEEGGDDEHEYDEDEFNEETRDEGSFDPIPKTPKSSDDSGNGEEDLGLNVGREEGHIKDEEEDELYRDVNINQGRGIQVIQEVKDSHVTLTSVNLDGMKSIFKTASTSVAPLPISAPTLTTSAIATTTTRTIDENIKKIIKKQVKEQVQVQVSKILPRIEQTMNEQLEAKVLTRSSHSSRTSYVVAADLSEMELKKILIEKMEGNKSIQRSDEQRNLYRALDEDQGSKRRREGKEPESTSAPTKTATRSVGRSTHGSRSRQASASESVIAEEPMQTTFHMDEPTHPDFDTGADD
nr:hypothetical protein [Tanacetum cinerariifolium]